MSRAKAGVSSRVSSLILSGGSSRILRLFLGRGLLLRDSPSGTPPQQQVAVPVTAELINATRSPRRRRTRKAEKMTNIGVRIGHA